MVKQIRNFLKNSFCRSTNNVPEINLIQVSFLKQLWVPTRQTKSAEQLNNGYRYFNRGHNLIQVLATVLYRTLGIVQDTSGNDMKSLIYVGPTATQFARLPKKKSRNSIFHYLWKIVFRIYDILVRIRIRGLEPLTNGTGSCSLRQWHSRRQKNIFFLGRPKTLHGWRSQTEQSLDYESDPDPAPEPAIFISRCQNRTSVYKDNKSWKVNKKQLVKVFLTFLFLEYPDQDSLKHCFYFEHC